MILEKHQESKAIILQNLERLSDIALALGMKSLASDIRNERLEKLQNEQFHLVILGEFNHGKSTFVNALLGASVLPTGITPTTAALNHVVFSERPCAKALTLDGEEISLSPAEIAEWVTVAGEHSSEIVRLEIGYPSQLLGENITLVDTPGVNDLNEQRADITYGYVPRADAVIFLLDASQALKDSEREFLSSHVLENSKDRLIFILGKIDLLSPDEQVAVINYVRKGLEKFVTRPVVFPLSAKDWLDTRDPTSGFPELLEHLSAFLDTDRSQIVLDNAAVDAERTAALIQQNIGIKLHALGLNMGDLESRVEEVKSQLNASKRKIDELHLRISVEIEAIKSQVQLALTDFSQQFAKSIPHEIDRVDANDLKHYLGPFVQDKFKEWSEMQGLVVSRSLEKLAEEIIAITNENIAEAFHSLSSRLGPSETQVTIDTDSFMYDLGVYALGALGTTVFMFVNTLAGGLLTLAAPILAIVVKSKVAGDMKKQAKERAPGVILQAGEAMGPLFDQCIDDFGLRLKSFVTTAGTNLYRGITEVLEKTVQERSSGSDTIAPLLQAVREQALEVASLQVDLGKARSAIWEGRVAASDTPVQASQHGHSDLQENHPENKSIPESDIDSGLDRDESNLVRDESDETRKDLN